MYKRLGIEALTPTLITLQLADHSTIRSEGIVENVLVQVKDFFYPADFVVIDMEEDEEIPIILGRPFLATGKTIIDVQQGKLTLA